MTSSLEGEGGGVWIPPKRDDVIYEQPLMLTATTIPLEEDLGALPREVSTTPLEA